MRRAGFLVVLLGTLMVSLAQAQVDTGLFMEAGPPAADLLTQDVTVVRQRWVRIDDAPMRAALPPPPGATPAGQSLTLNLFADTRLVAVLDRVEQTETGYVWVGRLPGVELSRVTLAVTANIMAGSISTPDTIFVIRHVSDGVHVIQELNRGALPREAPPLIPNLLPDAGDSPPSVAADDGSIIDLLVVYTPSARIAQGGTSAIEALIDVGVSETNQAYANSGVIQRIRLARKQEMTYTESGSMSTDLDRLTMTSDGFMDSVHSLRDTYGADVVQLIENNPEFCGIAWVMQSASTSFASFAFGITHYTCISPNYSFAHEMGHNMGLQHDIYVTGSGVSGAFPYSRGYVNQAAFSAGAPSSKRWRDIMAYPDQCLNAGFNCPKVLYFSNPLNILTGDPMGNASTADATRSLNNTRATVANFRASITRSLTINDATVTEGNSGTKNATFTVSLSPAGASTVTVGYATADGTASATSDYVQRSGTLTFASGVASQTLAVTIIGDTMVEPSETFTVRLSNASGAAIADSEGIGTITNDDSIIRSLTINDATVTEGHSGTKNATFTVSLSPAGASSVTVGYATADGTASATSDYVQRSGTLTFASGATSQTLAVTIVGDTIVEPSETFTVTLSNASGATIADAEGVGTITNDDFSFTDHPLTTGTFIKAVHIHELRTAINTVRAAKGLSAFGFADPVLTVGSSVIRVVHVTELRTALAKAYNAAGQSAPSYTDPLLTPGIVMKVVHIAEIRTAVANLP